MDNDGSGMLDGAKCAAKACDETAKLDESGSHLFRVPLPGPRGLRQLHWFRWRVRSPEPRPFFFHGARPTGRDAGKDHRNRNGKPGPGDLGGRRRSDGHVVPARRARDERKQRHHPDQQRRHTGGGLTASQNLTMVVAVSGAVRSSVDPTQGVDGKLQQFMSTSFQPAEWDYPYFQNHTASEPAELDQLGPQHIRLQGLSQAVPMRSNTGAATDWDFSKLDAVVQPVLSVGDHSPEFQIAAAPAFMSTAAGTFDITNHLEDFANYSANLVRYYNGPGFDWGGQHFESPSLSSASPHKITWWGIFNEYNINGLTPAEYVELYNTVVPRMLAVDPTIQFSALELSDFDFEEGDPRNHLPTFVLPANRGGVNAQVNVVSTHFYSSCNQQDTYAQIFSTIPGFVNDVKYFYQQLQLRPDLQSVPVWVTENNVNADFANPSGDSSCHPTQKFVPDLRGTSAFFAAWRPYVFSQLGKAGSRALYHWDYDSDAQFGEVDYSSGNKRLSYWVDYWLGQMYPQRPAAPEILALTMTETATVETLATKNSDGSVLVMIADRAVLSPAVSNGTGDARTVVLDVSALGSFTSASQLNIGRAADLTTGPQPGPITPAPKLI